MESGPEVATILYDGSCRFCVRAVGFIEKRDPGASFRLVPARSDVGRRLLLLHDLDPDDLGSLVLIENGRAHRKSTAVLRVARRMRGLWPILSTLLAIPRPLRDRVYSFVARHRYALGAECRAFDGIDASGPDSSFSPPRSG